MKRGIKEIILRLVFIPHWDLISRNRQAVVSGLYLFCVEDKRTGETQVGKFVIVK
ncbi:MAG: hypothetical protein KAW52_06430 [candidate division Zixibacteria bacterium]|nr:hypothetical protein [candidate division Zixibacteria bacterium]